MGGPRYVCGLPPTASRAEALGAGRPPIKTCKRTPTSKHLGISPDLQTYGSRFLGPEAAACLHGVNPPLK